MKLKIQNIVNPNIVFCSKKIANYISLRSIGCKIRLGDTRDVTSTNLRLGINEYVLTKKNRNNVFEVDNISFKMIYCPRNIFFMGSNDEFDSNPMRLEEIKSSFLLGETEVTQELFKAIMGYNPSDFQNKMDASKRPVECVTWYDAVMFCNNLSVKIGKRPYYNISNIMYNTNVYPSIQGAVVTVIPKANGFRLPLDKEWEYAAKAGTNNQYAGTNRASELEKFAWLDSNSLIADAHNKKGPKIQQTHVVKDRRSNEWGFYDMSGNVYEWCWDSFNPQSFTRVARGGSYNFNKMNTKTTVRVECRPNDRYNFIGFRIASNSSN